MIDTPSILRLIRKAAALERVLSTFTFRVKIILNGMLFISESVRDLFIINR